MFKDDRAVKSFKHCLQTQEINCWVLQQCDYAMCSV